MNKRIVFLLLLWIPFFAHAQERMEVSKDEIKEIRKQNRNQNTYTFYRLQKVHIQSSVWENANEEKKLLLKTLLPKVYDFVNSTSSFDITLLLRSRKKGKHMKEVLVKSVATGLKRPRMIGVILQQEYSDISNRILKISGQQYYSPIFYPRKYTFYGQTYKGDNKVFTAIHFSPKKQRKYTLEGYMYIDNTQLIEYFYAAPSDTGISFTAELMLENVVIDSLIHPSFSKVRNTLNLGKKKSNVLFIETTNKLMDIEASKQKLKTSNIILDFDQENKEITPYDSLFEQDTTTKALPSMDHLNKTLNYLEALRFGRLGAGKLDFLINHTLNYNLIEGVRMGLGIATNSKLSERFDIGGYFDAGLKDEKTKYGVFANLYLHQRTGSKFNIRYMNDLTEPGRVYFPFGRKLFINEGYRRFGLSRLDRTIQTDARFNIAVLKNIFLEVGGNIREQRPLYEYRFHDDTISFVANELSAGLRYNPDEKFFKFNNRLYSLGSKYPSFYVNVTKSVHSPYDYLKIDAKVEKEIKLLQYGKLNFQLIGGHVNKIDIPYPFLYNMKGSYKPGTPIIHNTFGTMGYNEFVASRYFALFYVHNIGKIANRKTFQPECLLVHNMGLGNAMNIDMHQYIDLKTMEKGYFESGFYLKNLISFHAFFAETGFGMGFLYRYGPYMQPRSIDNLVFKFSVDFSL